SIRGTEKPVRVGGGGRALESRASKKDLFHKIATRARGGKKDCLFSPPFQNSRPPPARAMTRRGMHTSTYAREGRPKQRGFRYDFHAREKRIKKGLFLPAPCFKNLLDAPP